MIRLDDIPFSGDFIIKDMTGRILHDSRTDGGDVPPLLTLAPVINMTAKDNFLTIEVRTDLNL